MSFAAGIACSSAFGKKLALFVIGAFAVISGGANATLMDRGGGMIYDDQLNITWLQNANYAATELSDTRRDQIIADVVSVPNTGGAPHTLVTSDFQKSGSTYTGRMTWWGAMAWAQDLVYGGFDDWRLATINLTSPSLSPHSCSDHNAATCKASGNELGYMYYIDLGGNSGNNKTGNQTVGGVTLNNIQPDDWSATEFNFPFAHYFLFDVGLQLFSNKLRELSAWAVRPGDVAAAPEPASLLLFGVGALGLALSRRRGRRR